MAASWHAFQPVNAKVIWVRLGTMGRGNAQQVRTTLKKMLQQCIMHVHRERLSRCTMQLMACEVLRSYGGERRGVQTLTARLVTIG